jgi:valyl-tRNA synthetase
VSEDTRTAGADAPALDKTFDPAAAEQRWAAAWESAGAFASGRRDGAPYCIVIPPPNVTGSLHMGHALNNTLQDILIRWRRMKGDDALWQPGMDHAGIATQMVVERQLAAQGIALARPGAAPAEGRTTIGRDAFIERVWAWKAESGGTITGQLRRLGASVDWARERFTMDEGLSAAVLRVFVELYREGLIYRDARLVNWDPKLHTAISDLEVEQREIKGSLWHIAYPVEGENGATITVATTRPETMLGDTAIAVHPDDPRHAGLIGKFAVLPLVGRRIPIVADTYSDPEKGTGAVKITPAHDFNDFEVGKRHGLPAINILTADARINDNAPEAYRGLDRFEARKRIVADLEALGALVKIEPHTHMVPHGDRGGVPIEPWLTTQWYVDAARLAVPAIEAVEQGRTVFVPQTWEKTYFHWMRNIEPWCISRQLWWGHQVPAWYAPDGSVFVDYDEAGAAAQARAQFGHDVVLTRDADVLDTWFSSALWPFSTLGWPERTQELARHYPTDVLVTGLDIIFFWVARMMMMGLHFMKDVPFRTVYIHALVRDEKGQKMSKSKGNIIDPLDLIGRYGADALRFTLAAMAAQGRDVKLAESRVEGYRNFATKLWNAARFCQMNACRLPAAFDPSWAKASVNRWILGEFARAVDTVDAALREFRFNEAAGAAYQFVWGSFCDWYLEFTKPVIAGSDDQAREETRAVTAYVLRGILQMLHPMMPFVTEELWDKLGHGADGMLILAPWPDTAKLPRDEAAKAELDWVVRAVTELRVLRAEMNVPNAARLELGIREASPDAARILRLHAGSIATLARLERIAFDAPARPGTAQLVLDGATAAVPLAGVIDPAAEIARLGKEIDRQRVAIDKIDRKLANADFLAKADPVVVDEQRERREETASALARLETAVERLRAL